MLFCILLCYDLATCAGGFVIASFFGGCFSADTQVDILESPVPVSMADLRVRPSAMQCNRILVLSHAMLVAWYCRHELLTQFVLWIDKAIADMAPIDQHSSVVAGLPVHIRDFAKPVHVGQQGVAMSTPNLGLATRDVAFHTLHAVPTRLPTRSPW